MFYIMCKARFVRAISNEHGNMLLDLNGNIETTKHAVQAMQFDCRESAEIVMNELVQMGQLRANSAYIVEG